MRHKVFISHHREADQGHKDRLVGLGAGLFFIDHPVSDGDIPDHWDTERIRERIRIDHLQDSSVTIVLVDPGAWRRKHVDWEIYASMRRAPGTERSGILVSALPEVYVPTDYEIERRVAEYRSIGGVTEKMAALWRMWANHMPWVPDRIIDNLVEEDTQVIFYELPDLDRHRLEEQVEYAYRTRTTGNFTFRRDLKRQDTEPAPGLVADCW